MGRRAWRWIHHPPERIGRRGGALLLFAFVWFVLGLDVLLNGAPTHTELLYHRLPVPVRVSGWWLTAAIAAYAAFQKPPRTDWYGFVALQIMPAERAFSYLWAWVVEITPIPGEGFGRAWVGFFIYSLFIARIYNDQGWSEPLRIIEKQVEK